MTDMPHPEEEIIEIVDQEGNVLGTELRSIVHGDPSKLHKVVHIMVFNKKGHLLLQKRSLSKDVAPGKWDTSVGGHMDTGESVQEAALRELQEELGVTCEPEFLYTYIHSNEYESELVYTFRCVHEGGFHFNRVEIDEVKFWDLKEIEGEMGSGRLSDNFEHEFQTYLNFV